MTKLNPPSHICGHRVSGTDRSDRDRWVASLPLGMSADRVGTMLGLSRQWVIRLYPHLAMSRAPETITPPTAARVSLPVVPSVYVTRDRPETDPRAGIITPRQKSLSIEERIEVIRQMWIKARAAA